MNVIGCKDDRGLQCIAQHQQSFYLLLLQHAG